MIKMETREIYTTSDGKEFLDENEAYAHEVWIRLMEFLESRVSWMVDDVGRLCRELFGARDDLYKILNIERE